MAASVNSPKFPCQIKKIKQTNNQNCSDCFDFESLSKSSCNTLKRNPTMDLSKPDLITLLSYLEGELQARDIVIATLKCEKVKYMLKYEPTRSSSIADPIAALCRDNFAAQTGSYEQLTEYEQQPNPFEGLITQQRRTLIHMANIFKEAEIRHKKVVQELVDGPKKKFQEGISEELALNGLADDNQGTFRQDMDVRRQVRKRLDSDLKSISDSDDKMRQKQIVLLLLAERKKIVMKYIEERKRSEDLAQILSEEKNRIDSMAEGLEEESKKSLQMEAELEKQIAQFDSESQVLKSNLLKEEKRVRELECELEKVRTEAALFEKQLSDMQQMTVGQTNTIIHNRSGSQLSMRSSVPVQNNTSVVGSVAKVVQPTATVSSVPVTGPTTGVARSIPSSQSIRGTAYSPPLQASTPQSSKSDKRPTVGVNSTSKPGPTSQNTSQSASSTNGSSDKKPVVTRGVPPPVPPNKPILLPKKDPAFKRVESNMCNSDTVKSKKDIKICPSESSDSSVLQNSSETYSNVKSVTE